MSTIYIWNQECASEGTAQAKDYFLIYDTSSGRTKKARISHLAFGGSSSGTLGFYGATAVDQGTMTATAITALATAVVSAANAVGVFGWSSSTVAVAYAKRASQIQADLKTFMQKVESTGLLNIAGV